MKREFLNSLVGKNFVDAEKICRDLDYEVMHCPHDVAMALVAYKNTVILYVKDDVVVSAVAGDPLELE